MKHRQSIFDFILASDLYKIAFRISVNKNLYGTESVFDFTCIRDLLLENIYIKIICISCKVIESHANEAT